jgi:hypothetical protein
MATGAWALLATNGEFGLAPGLTPVLLGLAVTFLASYRPRSRFKLTLRRVLVVGIVGVGLMWAVDSLPELATQSNVRVKPLLDAVTGGLVLTYGLVELLSFSTASHRTIVHSK